MLCFTYWTIRPNIVCSYTSVFVCLHTYFVACDCWQLVFFFKIRFPFYIILISRRNRSHSGLEFLKCLFEALIILFNRFMEIWNIGKLLWSYLCIMIVKLILNLRMIAYSNFICEPEQPVCKRMNGHHSKYIW